MAIKYLKTDGTWQTVSGGGGGGGGTASFASLTGYPNDNANLAAALAAKVPLREGNIEMGKDANGTYIWEA